MLFALIDLETTGLTDTDTAVEVAVALYDTTFAAVRTSFAALIQNTGNAAEATNGIPAAMLVDAMAPGSAWGSVTKLTANADVFVAWNADFDRSFCPPPIHDRPWVDAMEFVYPRSSAARSLIAVALAHGIGVSSVHRAATDVDLLARLMTRAKEMGMDIEEQVRRGLRPRALFEVADKSFDEARNQLCKDLGFKWVKEARAWRRKLAVEDAVALPFAVREVA